jgi:hypothetical protein
MGILRIRASDGKKIEVSWSSVEEEELAKKVFEEYINRGYIAIGEDPETGEPKLVRQFDAKYRKIDMWPPIYGG